MLRYLLGVLALVAAMSSPLAAEEPGRFAAKLAMEIRRGESTFQFETTVGGRLDRPHKARVGGVESMEGGKTESLLVEATLEPMQVDKTWFVLASFRVTEKRGDGITRVVAEPAILTPAGRLATFYSGAEKGDHLKIEFSPELTK